MLPVVDRVEMPQLSTESLSFFASSTSYASIFRAIIFTAFRGYLLMTDTPKTPFCSVEEAVEEIRNGRMIVLVDDEDRENEGDLTMAAEKITPEAINFMARFGRGLICMPLTEERCDELALPLMTPVNTSNYGTAFCESIDARRGTTTGISTSDRATTIL